MNKKGLIGKIFAIIGLIILITIIIAGITAYQAISLVNTVKTESASMQGDMDAFIKGNCSKLNSVEASFSRIKSKAKSACWNPIIKIAVDKMEQVPIKCKDIPTLESKMNSQFSQIKMSCTNQSNSAIKL